MFQNEDIGKEKPRIRSDETGVFHGKREKMGQLILETSSVSLCLDSHSLCELHKWDHIFVAVL